MERTRFAGPDRTRTATRPSVARSSAGASVPVRGPRTGSGLAVFVGVAVAVVGVGLGSAAVVAAAVAAVAGSFAAHAAPPARPVERSSAVDPGHVPAATPAD